MDAAGPRQAPGPSSPGPSPHGRAGTAAAPPGAAAVSAQGLTGAEVADRVARGLVNDVPAAPTRTVGQILRANVVTPFNLLLGSLLAVILVVGPLQDALFGLVIIGNTLVGVVQEVRAKRTLERLAVVAAPRARAVRDGRPAAVAVGEVVLDDLLLAAPGDQIVVDGEVASSAALEVDESLLTGESEPVAKAPGDEVLSGSFVAAGSGAYRAVRVGRDAYAARLAEDARRFTLARSELRAGIDRIVRLVAWVLVPTAVLLVVSQLRSQASVPEALRGAVAGTVAMVPEGLVLLTSVAFAVSVVRLGRRDVLVQELPAVETLARVDVVCFDKTGTITEGDLAVQELVRLPGGDGAEAALGALAGADPSPNATLRAIAAAWPSDGWPPGATVPFSSARKWSAATFPGHGTWLLGAPEVLLAATPAAAGPADADTRPGGRRGDSGPDSGVPAGTGADSGVPAGTGAKSGVRVVAGADSGVPAGAGAPTGGPVGGPAEHAALLRRTELLATDGKRVVLLASAPDPVQGERLPPDLSPRAFVVLGDRVRDDARPTVAYFHDQGVATKVVSGDHPRTVAAVAGRVGVPGADAPMDARTLPTGPAELGDLLERRSVFGRVVPGQKRAMVQAMQARGHVVAMTGDGVNDVLALKDADLGIAMGSGSAASRAVARLVLLDGRFASLPQVVAEGRRVIANIERVAKLFVTKTVYAMLLAVATGVAGLPFPFLPRHLTLVGSLTIGIPAFFLALEPNSRRARPGFVRRVVAFAAPVGIAAAAATFTAYNLARAFGGVTLDQERTAATLTLACIGLLVLRLVELPLTPARRALLAAMAAGLAGLLAVPWLREFFALSLPPAQPLLLALAMVAVVGVGMELIVRRSG